MKCSEKLSHAGSSIKENPKAMIGIGAGVAFIIFIVLGFVLFPSSNSNSWKTSQAVYHQDQGVIELPSYSVEQQVADNVGVSVENLKDTNRRVRVKSTIVDDRVFQEGDTIDKLMATPETASEALLTQVESTATLYDYNADTYAVKLNSITASGITTSGVKDIAFARDNYNGEVVDGINFDYDAGVAYVPKSAVDDYVPVDATQDDGNVLQAQLLYTMDSSRVEDVALQKCTVTNQETGESVETYAGSEMISNYTYVQLVSEEDAGKVDTSSIKLTANDGAVQTNSDAGIETNADLVRYNKETGMLAIQNNVANIGNISISLKASDAKLLSSSNGVTKTTVANMNFLKTADNKTEVVFKNLNGSAINKLLKDSAPSSVQFYTDGDAYVWEGNNPANEKLIGDTTYVSSEVEALYGDVEGEPWSAWSLDAGKWETIDVNTEVYSQQDYWWGTFDGQEGLHNYQPGHYGDTNYYSVKYVVHLSAKDHYPLSDNEGQYPAGADHKTQAVKNAGNSDGGSWDYMNQLNEEMYLKSWCTHVSESLKKSATEGKGCMYTRIIAADDYHLTLSLVGGPTQISGQTGSTIIKIKIAQYGGFKITKSSSNSSLTNGNGCYSLKGAKYAVFNSEEDANADTSHSGKNALWTMETDENGVATANDLWINQYFDIHKHDVTHWSEQYRRFWVREIYPTPTGYTLDTNVYSVDVFKYDHNKEIGWKDGLVELKLTDDPQNDPINVMLQKQSAMGGDTAQGAATFEGCEITCLYYDTTDPFTLPTDYKTRTSKAKRKWVFKTDETGVVMASNEGWLVKDKSDELFYITDDKGNKVITFPLGTYVIEETAAPAGFTKPTDCNLRTFITTIVPNANSTDVNTGSFGRTIYVPTVNRTYVDKDGNKYEFTGLGWSSW